MRWFLALPIRKYQSAVRCRLPHGSDGGRAISAGGWSIAGAINAGGAGRADRSTSILGWYREGGQDPSPVLATSRRTLRVPAEGAEVREKLDSYLLRAGTGSRLGLRRCLPRRAPGD
jgi:hypothetical protein